MAETQFTPLSEAELKAERREKAKWAEPATLTEAVFHPDLNDEMERMRAENAALKAKLEIRSVVQTEVSEAVMEQRRRDFGKPTLVAYVMPPKPEGVEMISVKLEKHYVPIGYFEVVGWDRPKIEKKGPGGQIVVIQEAAFINDERAPPALAGTGYANKIWAGTTIKLPKEEAKRAVDQKIASRGFD